MNIALINNTWLSRVRRGLAVAVMVGTVTAAAMPAMAQQRAGSDGRALDANQRAGGGGVNPEREQLDFRLRNDVVTGNVGDGRSFRGDVDYGAPGEFRDTTGADDFFPFRRDATGGTGSVYRPYASPHVARPNLRPGQIQTPWSVDGQQPFGERMDLSIRPDRPSYRVPLDRFMLDEPGGDWLEISASPLLGLRSDIRPGMGGADWRGEMNRWRDVPTLPDADDPLQWREEDWQIDQSLRQSSLLDTRSYQFPEGEATLEQSIYRSPRMSPTLVLGEQLRSQLLDPSRDPRQAAASQERIARLEEQMFRPLQSVRSVEPGEDVYLDLLMAMQGDGADRRWENRLGGEAERNGDAPTDERGDPFAVPDVLRRDGEGAGDEADREMRVPADDADAEQGGVLQHDRNRAEALLDRLDHDLPPLQTLAGSGEGATNRLLREAEQLLSNGRFFDAEALYREIVVREVDAPMARVGLTHAQLSAGMIRSAATNLRTLFEQHPELIATRYDAKLLPPADRQAWIMGELRRMMGDDDHAPSEAALLLAYLGYQQDDEAVIREGLDAVQVREEHGGLLRVLERIWLEEPIDAGAADEVNGNE